MFSRLQWDSSDAKKIFQENLSEVSKTSLCNFLLTVTGVLPVKACST